MKKVLLVLLAIFLPYQCFSPELDEELKQKQTIETLSFLVYEQHMQILDNFVRNNNPFNIRYSNRRDWEGKIEPCDRGFERFSRLDYGIKAGFELLQIYYESWGLTTIESIFYRYAPPHENNTDQYIAYLSRMLNYPKNKAIPIYDKEFMINLTYFLIKMETGKYIEKEVLDNVYTKYIT
jgi:hypothetical protein